MAFEHAVFITGASLLNQGVDVFSTRTSLMPDVEYNDESTIAVTKGALLTVQIEASEIVFRNKKTIRSYIDLRNIQADNGPQNFSGLVIKFIGLSGNISSSNIDIVHIGPPTEAFTDQQRKRLKNLDPRYITRLDWETSHDVINGLTAISSGGYNLGTWARPENVGDTSSQIGGFIAPDDFDESWKTQKKYVRLSCSGGWLEPSVGIHQISPTQISAPISTPGVVSDSAYRLQISGMRRRKGTSWFQMMILAGPLDS